MNNLTKTFGAIAIAGVITAGGSAFTAGGLSNTAASSQFVGGTVSQTVTGATLADIDYTFSDSSQTAITTITLTLADGADGKQAAAVAAGAGAGTFTCENVSTTVNDQAVCLYVPAAAEPGYAGLTGLAVTIS